MNARWLVLLLLVACVESSSVVCGDQQVCPSGSTCTHLTGPGDDGEDVCATREQVAACAGVAEGETCNLAGVTASWCHDGVCLPILCGNSRVDATEACDDGNTESGDTTCSADCSSSEQCGNGVVDPLVRVGSAIAPNEQCDDGNALSGDGCSSTCKTEQPRWSQLSEQPGLRSGSAIAYDSLRKRIVLFGGRVDDGATNVEPIGGLFEWNGDNWASIPATVQPSARYHASMAYDSARRRLVLFGGQVGNAIAPLGDLWEWDGTNWALRTPAVAPTARTQAAMVYDTARKKIVLFGGFADSATGIAKPSDETWEWDGTTWTQVTTTLIPGARHTHVMAYDPRRAVTVMAGGYDDTNGSNVIYRRDTWEYNGTAWVPVSSAPADLDSKAMLAFDPTQNRMIAFGGIQPGPNAISTTTWSYSGGTWTADPDTTPQARYDGAMATDLSRGEIILFGGIASSGAYVDTTWRWNGSDWGTGAVQVFVPPRMYHTRFAPDPTHLRTWVLGNFTSIFETDQLLSFDGTTWKHHPAVPVGSGPPGRLMPALAYDPLLDQLVVFGGSSGGIGTGETWVFDGTTWSQKLPGMAPSPRFGSMMYFDPNRARIVLFSGLSDTPGIELWEWTGTTWQPITTGSMPGTRFAAGATFDAARGVFVLHGGTQLSATFSAVEDLWHFDGTSWTQRASTDPLPDRIYAPIVYDVRRKSVLLFGGQSTSGVSFADTWQWDGTTWEQLSIANSPPARGAHVIFPAPEGNGVVVYGGDVRPYAPLADTWQLRYESTSPVEQCLLSVDDDRDGLTGCADPDCWARCTPMCPPDAAICPATFPRCGDGTCNTALESCRNCTQDCPTCAAVCGDGFCDAPETLSSCPGDCTP